ncbi:hypothetical protein ACFE04_021007 [Oxalis oulophora]
MSINFTWRFDNFSKLKNFSEEFTTKGYRWRIQIYPSAENLEFLLEISKAAETMLPYDWSIDADFSFAVLNQFKGKDTTIKGTDEKVYRCNEKEYSWRYSILPLSELKDPKKGYMVYDTLILKAEVYANEIKSENSDIWGCHWLLSEVVSGASPI